MPLTPARRLIAALAVLPSLALGLTVAGTMPVAQASGTYNQLQHTLVQGDRGNDVKALQWLLTARGFSTTADGNFGSGTKSKVQSFQSSRGLTADGIVGPNTWNKLHVTVRRGSTGPAVKAAQLMLAKQASVAVDGDFGPATESAVRTFQSEHGLSADGIVGSNTWTKLLGHFKLPNSNHSCGYYSASERWGTASAVRILDVVGSQIKGTHGKPGIGDLSRTHGGDIDGHGSHEVGLDADVRPFRDDKNQCNYGTQWNWDSYDRAATRDYIKALLATGRVRFILFNDKQLIDEGLTQYYRNHDNHLHIRFREAGFSHEGLSYN